MTNIVATLREAEPGSLILFDELGAGTDPVEGAALAVAIIEQARAQDCRVAATTHYAELKMYALSTAGVENASCEFDVETLRPTYRLLIGIPGRSNAFAISKRLGLSETVIEAAQRRVGSQDAAFEDVLTQLERRRQAMESEHAGAERARRQTEEDQKRAEELRRRVEWEHERVAESARAEARQILNTARQAADEIIRELNRTKQEGGTADGAEVRRRLNEVEKNLGGGAALPELPGFSEPPPTGTEVALAATGIRAVVLGPPDKNGQIPLQAGIMKVTASLDGIMPCTPKKEKKPPVGSVSVSRAPEGSAMELDLRGQPTDDGILLMERFIDDAVTRRLATVFIIHGKGTGALRAAVHQALRKNPSVKGFRLGKFGEGETGVTVVTIDN